MASPYIRDFRNYNSVNAASFYLQRPSYEPGDIILVIFNSGDWSVNRRPTLAANGFTQLNGYSNTNNEPYNLRVIFYKIATSTEPASYLMSVSSAYERTTVSIMTIANAELNKVHNTQSTNTSLGIAPKDCLVIASLTYNNNPPISNGPYGLLLTGITGNDSRSHPVYQKSYSSTQTIVSASSATGWNSTYMIYLVFTEKITNVAPTAPNNLLGITENKAYLAGETIDLQWSASTDADGDSITYDIEFSSDGSVWSVEASNLTATTKKVTVKSVTSKNCYYRIRAKDSKGAYSSYLKSVVFSTYKYLVLIESSSQIKSYKNSNWINI